LRSRNLKKYSEFWSLLPQGYSPYKFRLKKVKSLSLVKQISLKNKSDGNFARDKTANSEFWNFKSEGYPTHPYKFWLRKVKPWVLFKKNHCRTNSMHFLLPICGKFTRALLAHQIFVVWKYCLCAFYSVYQANFWGVSLFFSKMVLKNKIVLFGPP
jgi:hypothetical protein